MNNCPIMEHQAATTCVHPECLFKKPGFKARRFTKLLFQQLREESMESIDPEFKQILARPRCMPCALRVIRGGKACLTEAEQNRLHDMGRWHQRRRRRHKHWGYQPGQK